jgi:hypothetical protein
MTELEPNRDDFRKIKRITRPMACALYEQEINRFSDLASLTPEKLAELLNKKNVKFVSAQLIEKQDWIGQARVLAKQQEQAAAPEAHSALADPQGYSQAQDPPNKNARESWNELAHFDVSFGNRIKGDGKPCLKTIVFSQADQDYEWDGIANGEELVRWMLDRANLPTAKPPEPGIAPPASLKQPERFPEIEPQDETGRRKKAAGLLTISNLWVSQVKQAESAQRMIRVEADIDLPPEAAALLIGPTSFTISIFLVNSQTNRSIFIEPPSITVSQYDLPYAFQHDFPVPPPGRYQLFVMAGLPSARAPILQQGPVVRVEG